jgi:hypothetical protein
MKSVLSVVVALSLVASPLAGCATTRGPHQISDTPDSGTPSESDWSRVGEVAPAAELEVTIRGSQPGVRFFVRADQSGLTVLNLTGPALTAATTRVLRDMAFRHPELFAAMQQGQALAEDNVRVGRDGVFVADRKIADLGQVVETIARNDVIEITGPVVARGSVVGAVLGGWVGFAVGVVPGLGGVSPFLAWSLLIGSVVVGGSLGSHWTSHETEGVIYHAP